MERRLAALRAQIDAVDLELLALLNERTRVVEEVGRVEKALALPIHAPQREQQVLKRAGNVSARRVLELIIAEMHGVQKQVSDGE